MYNLSVQDLRFEVYTIPSVDDFVDGVRDKLLLWPFRALRKHLSQIEQFRPEVSLRGCVTFLEIVFVGQCKVFVCFDFVHFFSPLAAKLIGPFFR